MPHELKFLAGFELPELPTIFDVGANVGQYAIACNNRWPGCHLTCFEPNPAACMELTRNVDEFGAGVYLNEVALSNREGTLILNHAGGTDQSASLHKRDLGYAGVNLHPQGTAVPVSRLIDHLPERSVVDLLKIDAEGHELFVMLGAGEKLIPSRVTNIQWEINSCALDSRTFFKDFWTMLTERGYSISQINSEGVVQPPIARYDPSLEDFAAHREFLASPA